MLRCRRSVRPDLRLGFAGGDVRLVRPPGGDRRSSTKAAGPPRCSGSASGPTVHRFPLDTAVSSITTASARHTRDPRCPYWTTATSLDRLRQLGSPSTSSTPSRCVIPHSSLCTRVLIRLDAVARSRAKWLANATVAYHLHGTHTPRRPRDDRQEDTRIERPATDHPHRREIGHPSIYCRPWVTCRILIRDRR